MFQSRFLFVAQFDNKVMSEQEPTNHEERLNDNKSIECKNEELVQIELQELGLKFEINKINLQSR